MLGEVLGGVIGGGLGLIGAHQNKVANVEANEKNAQLQREFAQNGLRWKVEDAKAAGIHPLYALGASGYSAAPSFVGDSSMGNAMADLGQNVSRAIQSGRTPEEQDLAKLTLANVKTDLYGKQIDNAIRAEQLKQLQSAGKGIPGSGSTNFIPGQADSRNLVEEVPLKKTVSQPDRPGQEAGWRPDVSYSRSDDAFHPQIPESLSESMEDQLIPQVMWGLRNYVLPNLGAGDPPAASQLPPGFDKWNWSVKKQGWVPAKKTYWEKRTDTVTDEDLPQWLRKGRDWAQKHRKEWAK